MLSAWPLFLFSLAVSWPERELGPSLGEVAVTGLLPQGCVPTWPGKEGSFGASLYPACAFSRVNDTQKQNPAQTKHEGCQCTINDLILVEIRCFGYTQKPGLTIERSVSFLHSVTKWPS